MQSNHMGCIAVSVSQRRRQSWLTSEFQGPITEKLKFHKPERAWRPYSDLGMTSAIVNIIGKVKKVGGMAYWSISKHSQDPRCTELSASPRGRGSRAQKYTIASALREHIDWRNSSVVQYLPIIHGTLGFIVVCFWDTVSLCIPGPITLGLIPSTRVGGGGLYARCLKCTIILSRLASALHTVCFCLFQGGFETRVLYIALAAPELTL